jgi:hypothetical protein
VNAALFVCLLPLVILIWFALDCTARRALDALQRLFDRRARRITRDRLNDCRVTPRFDARDFKP